MCFVYIIQNPRGKYYIGYTQDIEDRLKRHNRNCSGLTKNKGIWKLVYKENFSDKKNTIKRENYIKNQKSKRFIEGLISYRGVEE